MPKPVESCDLDEKCCKFTEYVEKLPERASFGVFVMITLLRSAELQPCWFLPT